MKFCTKCGKELHDEAVICTGCGCMVAPNRNLNFTHVKREKKECGTFSLVPFFDLCFLVASTIGLLFISLPILLREEDILAFAIVFSIISTVFASLSFSLTLNERKDVKQLLVTIAELVYGLLFIALSFIVACSV